MAVRVLTGHPAEGEVDDDLLDRLYAAPSLPWLRVNMVSTVDGAATGPDGRTGSINNPADKRVFDLLRRQADAIVVGAGTAAAERYAPVDRPTVLVTRRATLPPRLEDGPPGSVLMATCASAPGLARAREVLGNEHVLVLGSHRVDLAVLREQLAGRGLRNLLSEGGPHLLRDLLAAGVADEVCTTVVPRLVGGDHPRITLGPPVDAPLSLHLLLEEDGTLLARWLTRPVLTPATPRPGSC